MNKFGILATLQARPGKETEVETFLQSAGPLVEAETGTTTWFAFRISAATLMREASIIARSPPME